MVEAAACALCASRGFAGESPPSANCDSVHVHFFLSFFFFLAHADALVRVWVRDQTHLGSGLEEQRTPGYGGPEGILLRAERT